TSIATRKACCCRRRPCSACERWFSSVVREKRGRWWTPSCALTPVVLRRRACGPSSGNRASRRSSVELESLAVPDGGAPYLAKTRVFLTAEWRHLVMLNYEIDPRVLEPRVPKGTD